MMFYEGLVMFTDTGASAAPCTLTLQCPWGSDDKESPCVKELIVMRDQPSSHRSSMALPSSHLLVKLQNGLNLYVMLEWEAASGEVLIYEIYNIVKFTMRFTPLL